MNTKEAKRISKFLSLVLRHRPETIGLYLDNNGWAKISELIDKAAQKDVHFNNEDLEWIVANNDKQRFAFNEDHSQIRANQGHSLQAIDLQLQAIEPPHTLYHGTVSKFIASIKTTGLQKRNRQHVHLSADLTTATTVGSRRGAPVILKVEALKMHQAGYIFYQSENGVWLTDEVPVNYIKF